MLPTFTTTNIVRSVTALLAVSSVLSLALWFVTANAAAQITTAAPTLTLFASVVPGGATISWTVTNASSCIASQGNPGWAGMKSAQGGSQVVKPNVTTAFAMECWSANGFTSGQKQLHISPDPTATTGTTPNNPTDNTAILNLINQLMAQIASLQQQLNALNGTPGSPVLISPIAAIQPLTQNLSRGSRGPEVVSLQNILAFLSYLEDESISGYFGTLTEAAVKKFQCDRSIVCAGTVTTTGYGAVGSVTRAALNAAIGTGTPTIPTCPAGTIWNGVLCAVTSTSRTAPTARLIISPNVVTYPTPITFELSSTNAQSCSIVGSDGQTYVAPSDNLTSRTITNTSTPQTTSFETKCWTGQNGAGTVSAVHRSTLTVNCPSNTNWNGSVCTSAMASTTVIKVADQKLRLSTGNTITYDLYRPSDWSTRAQMPGFLWIHGGGWVGGDKSEDAAIAIAVARQGVSVLVPNYTFGIASVNETALIAKRLFESATDFNIDDRKISLGGGSAGAHLALMAATMLGSTKAPRCVIDVAGPTDLSHILTQADDYPVTIQIIANVFGTSSALLASNSPIRGINSLHPATRFLIAHQKLDNLVPFTQATRMADALEDEGFSVQREFRETPNPYPTKAGPDQITHLFTESESTNIVQSYFSEECI